MEEEEQQLFEQSNEEQEQAKFEQEQEFDQEQEQDQQIEESQEQQYQEQQDQEQQDQEQQDQQQQDQEQQDQEQQDQEQQQFSQEQQDLEQNNSAEQQNLQVGQQEEGIELKKLERKWQWATPLIEGVPPCPRGGHSATLSGASIIVFGGHYYAGKSKGYIYLNDTYVLDVNSNRWNKPKISGTPPEPRFNHSAILAGSRIIIFGGKGQNSTVFRDLHALDPVTMCWYQGPEGSGSPSARFGHTASLVNGTKMLIFAGWNGTDFYNDLYVLDLEVMAWSKPNPTGPVPSQRQGHTAIQVGSNLIIQGGFCFNEDYQNKAGIKQGSTLRSCYFNDIRILDTENWVWSRLRVSGTPPRERYGHTSNISGPDIMFFGGWTSESGDRQQQMQQVQQSGEINYLIVLNTETMSWEKPKAIGTPPLNRYGHTTISIGPHLLIFGGWEYSRATNEVVVLRDLNVGGGPTKDLKPNK